MIPVTKPFLPPKSEYEEFLNGIWKREWLTNMGPLSSDLELRLKDYLNINHLIYVTNGTIALQMAIKALKLIGEIITTPFSFIATTSSIVWENCNPIFVDIDAKSLNIDANKIEAAITKNTSAILVTHVYGNPCDVVTIDRIAKKYNLKVIYDAAHAFGVKINGKSVFEFGDISTCSLHATKLYHSIEGGLICTTQSELIKKLSFIRNFGFKSSEEFSELGINGKNSEFHAAMGLVNLKYIDSILFKRSELSKYYMEKLKNLNISIPLWNLNATKNSAYFPIIFESEEKLLKSVKLLTTYEIYTRRYFYPSLATALPYLKPNNSLIITEDISKRVLCLPLYYDLSFEEIDLICRLLLRAQNN